MIKKVDKKKDDMKNYLSSQSLDLINNVLVFHQRTGATEECVELIDLILAYELLLRVNTRDIDGKPIAKPLPTAISHEKHVQYVTHVFKGVPNRSRAELVHWLSQCYGVGTTKIEQKGGYLSFLLQNKYIAKRTVKGAGVKYYLHADYLNTYKGEQIKGEIIQRLGNGYTPKDPVE
jgi:hypothetical protein